MENNYCLNVMGFSIQTDKVLEYRQPDIVVLKNKRNAKLSILQSLEIKRLKSKERLKVLKC